MFTFYFFSEKDHYQRQFPDLPRQTDFWTEVFHNGFKCDYYNNYLDGQCHEILDRNYKFLTTDYYKDAFKSLFEVNINVNRILYKILLIKSFKFKNSYLSSADIGSYEEI